MTKPEIAKVHFSIEGDYITDIARTRMQEGDWRHALKILDCMEGLPLDDQISILKGDKYLTGSNDLELLEDTREETKEYKQSLKEQYGKTLRFNKKFYEAYAFVDSWCKQDLPSKEQKFSELATSFTREFETEMLKKFEKDGYKMIQKHPYARSLHYADNPEEDFAFGVFNSPEIEKFKPAINDYIGKVILFKEVEGDVPFFLEYMLSKTPIEALATQPYLGNYGANVDYNYLEDKDIVFSNPKASSEPAKKFQDLKYPDYNSPFYDQQLKQYLDLLRKEISDYADNDKQYGWKTLVDDENRTLKVPGRAFMHYALNKCLKTEEVGDRFDLLKQLPPYEPFSPTDLKMRGDDRMHTDAWFGAGLDLDNAYGDQSWETALFFRSAFDFQKNLLDYDFHLLSRGGLQNFKGITCSHTNYEEVPEGQRILVIPHLGVEFEQAALKCDAIITEQGGPLAHLMIVGKERKQNWPVIRVDNACVRFGIRLALDIDLINGKIQTQEKTAQKIKP